MTKCKKLGGFVVVIYFSKNIIKKCKLKNDEFGF